MSLSTLEVKLNNSQGKSLSSILGKNTNENTVYPSRQNSNRGYQPLSREQKESKNIKENSNIRTIANPRVFNPKTDINTDVKVNSHHEQIIENKKSNEINDSVQKIIDLPNINDTSKNNDTPKNNDIANINDTPKNNDTRNIADRRWNRSSQITSTIPKYEKNSMAYIVSYFQREIYERATKNIFENLHPNDINAMKNFQEKFSKVSGVWKGLMDFMMKKFSEIDAVHIYNDYYGYKDILTSHILNMSLSFIIIGGDTYCGDGIDNFILYKENIKETSDTNTAKQTIREKIKKFLLHLPTVMNKISGVHNEILNFNREHSNCLENVEYATSLIQTLKTHIKKQQDEITRCNKNKIRELQESLDENKESLQQAIFNKNLHEKKIQEIIDKKNMKNSLIKEYFNELSRSLNFSYFMHDDWCPPLEYEIMPIFGVRGA